MRPFTLDDKQEAQYIAWATEHQKTCVARPDFSCALYTFMFTPSGLGDNIHVQCPCGEKIYLDASDGDI